MTHWHNLPAGAELRRIVAERCGWHMRKTWVGSGGVEYDYLVYNEDDMLVYQQEISTADLSNESQAERQTWLEAVNDDDCPRWDEDLNDTLELVFGLDHQIVTQGDGFTAWVKAPEHSGQASTEALALLRAWLHATEGNDEFLKPD